MKKVLDKVKELIDRRALVLALAVVIISIITTLGSSYTAGWLTYIASFPALIGLLITCLARINDISPTLTGWVWQARRFGLAIVGSTSVAFLYLPFSNYPLFPSWLVTSLFWGYFITWLSTPNMPPWYDYITRDRTKKAI